MSLSSDKAGRIETGRPAYNGSGSGFRIMLYSHDTFGLGHLSRNLKIASALKIRYPNLAVLTVTGSPQAHNFAHPDGTDYIKLPSVQKVDNEGYAARSLGVPFKRVLAVRKSILSDTIRNFEPHVLLVDHAPLGMKKEIVPCLEWVAENRDKSRAVLGLRDILDNPSNTIKRWNEQGIYEAMRVFYNRVLIYGMPTIYDPVSEYEFPEDIKVKADYCGYIANNHDHDSRVPAISNIVEKPLVLVTIGGGDGGELVIDRFLEMLRLSEKRDFESVILTGPFLSSDKWDEFEKEARETGTKIYRYVQDIGSLMSRSALVISTGGYNTVTDILRFASKAIVVPRILYREEQLIRARRFSEIGLLKFMHPDDLTPESLGMAINETITEDNSRLAEARSNGLLWLDGAGRLAGYIGETLAEIENVKEKVL